MTQTATAASAAGIPFPKAPSLRLVRRALKERGQIRITANGCAMHIREVVVSGSRWETDNRDDHGLRRGFAREGSKLAITIAAHEALTDTVPMHLQDRVV